MKKAKRVFLIVLDSFGIGEVIRLAPAKQRRYRSKQDHQHENVKDKGCNSCFFQ